MKLRIIIITATALIICACGVRKSLTTNNIVTENAPDRVVTEKIILKPVWGDNRQAMEIATQDVAEEVEQEKNYVAIQPKEDYPEIVFSPDQCRYLQIRGINPLPASGVLELDLDALGAEFCYPYNGNLISPYGRRGSSYHTGVDIKAIPNDTIRAALPGVVRMSKVYSDYGNIVVIRHYQGFETVYAHPSKLLVEVNDVVKAGDPIALAGRTGRATTEHLHFEVRAGDSHIDPRKFIDTDNRTLRSGKLYFTKLDGALVAYTGESELSQMEQSAAQKVSEKDVKPQVGISTAATAASDAKVYYKVKKGDTLTSIASKNKTTVAKICQLSNIKSTTVLQINQRLRVK